MTAGGAMCINAAKLTTVTQLLTLGCASPVLQRVAVAAARKEGQLGAQNAIPTAIVPNARQTITKVITNVTRTALVGKDNISRVQVLPAQEAAAHVHPANTSIVLVTA